MLTVRLLLTLGVVAALASGQRLSGFENHKCYKLVQRDGTANPQQLVDECGAPLRHLRRDQLRTVAKPLVFTCITKKLGLLLPGNRLNTRILDEKVKNLDPQDRSFYQNVFNTCRNQDLPAAACLDLACPNLL